MKEKISLSIDVKKLQKDRFRENSFTTKSGEEVNQLLAELVVIPTEEKTLVSKDTYDLVKVGFIVEKGTKEENTNIVGDALKFVNKGEAAQTAIQEDINPEDIPF